MIAPTLKYEGTAIESDTDRIHMGPKTVSCELNDAGPPLPEVLELLVLEGSEVNETSSRNWTKDDAICTWSYVPPLTIVVNNITGKVRMVFFYRNSGIQTDTHQKLLSTVPSGVYQFNSIWKLISRTPHQSYLQVPVKMCQINLP